MSGTSVDGLDMAYCRFTNSGGRWSYEIIKTQTLPYSGTGWAERLIGADRLGGLELMELHRDFGRFTGNAVNRFLIDPGQLSYPGPETETGIAASPGSTALPKPDLIASHGHTVFHQPGKGITLQIGDGAEIAATTGILTVSDFRRLDVALGGQGAPLVPIGDELLFADYRYCLNLGGFANISFRESGKRVAFDICPVNIVLNILARHLGMEYDRGGTVAASGKVDAELLERLESLDFYSKTGPRSLGKEWVDEVFMPVVEASDAPVEGKLRTVCEHVAMRIAAVTTNADARPGPPEEFMSAGKIPAAGDDDPHPSVRSTEPDHTERSSGAGATGLSSLLVTGGGARNGFLMKLISRKAAPVGTVIPDGHIIDFKEAIVFAFLGVLRLRNEVNCLASVTGAHRDNSGGIISLP